MSPRRSAAALAVALSIAAASACSGERATLSGPPDASAAGGAAGAPVGDAGVDAVLGDLERAMTTSFTATYRIERKLGGTKAEAVVSRGPLATSVTVGDVRFVRADADHTCVLSAGTCEDRIDDARISDVGVASTFWRDAPARALRVTYGRRAAAPTAGAETIAGQAASCVAVAVGTGTERYCSVPAGAIARWDTAYVAVELVAWEPNVRPDTFTIPVEKRGAGS